MDIKRLSCPACHANTFEHDTDGNLICEACGNIFEGPRDELVCRTCGTVNPAVARRCMNCGGSLGRLCATCGHPNPPGSDVCLECGSPLDALAAVTARTPEGQRRTTSIMRDKLVETKTADEIYMREQREHFEQQERERLARLAAQKEAASAEQQSLVLIVVGIAVFLIAIGAIIALVLI